MLAAAWAGQTKRSGMVPIFAAKNGCPKMFLCVGVEKNSCPTETYKQKIFST
jgi:hypothetical protein